MNLDIKRLEKEVLDNCASIREYTKVIEHCGLRKDELYKRNKDLEDIIKEKALSACVDVWLTAEQIADKIHSDNIERIERIFGEDCGLSKCNRYVRYEKIYQNKTGQYYAIYTITLSEYSYTGRKRKKNIHQVKFLGDKFDFSYGDKQAISNFFPIFPREWKRQFYYKKTIYDVYIDLDL